MNMKHKLSTLAFCLAGTTACGPVGGRSSSSSGAVADAGAGGFGLTFGAAEVVGPDDPSANGGLALALASSGEVSVAYFVDLTSTQLCVTNLNMQQIAESELKVARGTSNPDDGFTLLSLDHPRSSSGVGAAYDSAGVLNVAYTGGMNGSLACFASDLMLATLPAGGATATLTNMADNGNNGTVCNAIQGACNKGDVIGQFPSVAFMPDGTRVVSTIDRHFGISEQTDKQETDLEVFVGGVDETPSNNMGNGYQGHLFMANGLANVVHVQIWDHVYTNISQTSGVWLSRRKADATWEHIQVDATKIPTNQISGAWHPTQGYAVAYEDPVAEDLWVATSPDGVTWTKENVDQLGRVGRTPSVGWSGEHVVVAYGACNAVTDLGGTCNPAHDGVKVAFKDAGQWHVKPVYNNEEQIEGSDVRMVMDPNGNPTIAFKSQGTRKVMVVRGTHP
jgi:hypothetical protein